MPDANGLNPSAITRLRNTLRRARSWIRTKSSPSRKSKAARKSAIGKAVGDAKLRTDGEADKSVDKIQKYASGLNDAVRDAEAMKSAGLLVASPIRRDAGP